MAAETGNIYISGTYDICTIMQIVSNSDDKSRILDHDELAASVAH